MRIQARKKDIEKMFAVWVKGDALNKDDVDKAFKQIEGLDAVITTIGEALFFLCTSNEFYNHYVYTVDEPGMI
jgi:hypothetical protein